MSKNKIIDSKIEEPVKKLVESEDEGLRSLAEKVYIYIYSPNNLAILSDCLHRLSNDGMPLM